jgi:hypothetical protein
MNNWNGEERRKDGFEAVKEAAKQGVYEALADLVGYNLDEPEGKARFRSNQNYVDELNQACHALKRAGLMALAGTGVSTLIAVLALGVREWFKKGGN